MEQDYINSLVDAYRYLDCLSKYDDLINKYSSNTDQHREKYFQLKNRQQKSKFKPLLMYVFFLPVIFALLGCLFAGEMSVIMRAFIWTILIIVLIAPFLASSLIKKSEKQTNLRFQNEAVQYWQKTGGPAEKSNNEVISRIRKERNEIVSKYSFVIRDIPPDYQNLTACGFIITALMNKRADTLKEAINLYEETLHRLRLENAAQNLMGAISSMQNEIIYQMQSINSNIDKTNSRLRDIENLEFYNTFFK